MIHMFCSAGKHAGPEVNEEKGKEIEVPQGWRLLRVSVDSKGNYYYNPNSRLSIYVCPKCTLKGEPEHN
jgi:hypothetical protein